MPLKMNVALLEVIQTSLSYIFQDFSLYEMISSASTLCVLLQIIKSQENLSVHSISGQYNEKCFHVATIDARISIH